MHGQLPVLSEAEQSLQREMNEMQDKMEQLQNALQQVSFAQDSVDDILAKGTRQTPTRGCKC